MLEVGRFVEKCLTKGKQTMRKLGTKGRNDDLCIEVVALVEEEREIRSHMVPHINAAYTRTLTRVIPRKVGCQDNIPSHVPRTCTGGLADLLKAVYSVHCCLHC